MNNYFTTFHYKLNDMFDLRLNNLFYFDSGFRIIKYYYFFILIKIFI